MSIQSSPACYLSKLLEQPGGATTYNHTIASLPCTTTRLTGDGRLSLHGDHPLPRTSLGKQDVYSAKYATVMCMGGYLFASLSGSYQSESMAELSLFRFKAYAIQHHPNLPDSS